MEELRTCSSCGETKPITEYHWHYKDKGIRRYHCKVCRSNVEKERQRSDAYKEKRKDYNLQKAYGISSEEYEQKLKYQNYGCAICGRKATNKALAVDHCHETGKIRDILCGYCNVGLGSFFDRPELLEKAADYIRKHNGGA